MRNGLAGRLRTRRALALSVALAAAPALLADDGAHGDGVHRDGRHGGEGSAVPGHGAAGTAALAAGARGPLAEPGQGAFAALAEAVAVLAADPETDWSRVDIDALREHLVMMDALVTDAVVERREVDGGHAFVARGEGRTREAIRTMVPAHAQVLAATTPWMVEASPTDAGAVLTVRSDDPGEREKIAALGFFGLMATGDHHRAHHWAMARGAAMHGH